MNKKINILMALACVGVLASCGSEESSSSSSKSEESSSSSSKEDVCECTEVDGDWAVPCSVCGDYEITVWCAEEVSALTTTQINRWASAYYPGGTLTVTVTAVGEGDAATSVVQDIEKAADLFCYANDQTARLVQAGCLTQLVSGSKYYNHVVNNNSASAIASATFGTGIYSFPITADNGYFLYYDSTKLSETDVATWDGIIEVCKEENYVFYYDYGNIWYSLGMFFGTGCVEDWETDDDGNFTGVTSTVNDSTLGIAAAKQLWDMGQSGVMVASSDAASAWVGTTETDDDGNEVTTPAPGNVAAVVSGTWDSSSAKAGLGDGYAVTVLPSFTQGGVTYHTGGFTGAKLIGVKPHEDTNLQVICQNLAGYLSDTECSLERFESNGWGPSNITAAADDAVIADEALTALNTECTYTAPNGNAVIRPQNAIPNSWWSPASTLTTSIVTAVDGSDSNLQSILDAYVNNLSSYLTTD